MFQIPEFTEARVASITNRVEKRGDDEKPAVSIGVEIEAANTMLYAIDAKLREALFKAKPDAEPELDGIEQSTPVLRCNSIDRVTLPTKHEGLTLAIDAGIEGDVEPLKFGGVKADKFSVEPKQGGTVVLRMRLGTSDVDAARLGWLGMHNGEAIWITLMPPEKKPDAIDGTGAEFEADHPEAGDLFAAEHGADPDDIDDDEDAGPELEDRLDNALAAADAEALSGQASKDALDASGNKPFGAGGDASSEVEKPEAKPRRGRKAAADVE